MQAAAYLPDGRVEPLIYLHDYRPQWQRTYWFREPIGLPKDTRILLFSSEPVAGELLIQP